LAEAATANLTADALADRWVAVLEAAAFTPIRTQVSITSKPETVPAELTKTVERLAALLPQIASAFGVEAGSNHAPKPLRPTRPAKKLPPRPPAPPAAPAAAAPAESAPEVSAPAESAPSESAPEVSPATSETVPETVAETGPETGPETGTESASTDTAD
jgi:hypothetical protein